MSTFMFSPQGELGSSGFHIGYEELYDLGRDYVQLAGHIYHGDAKGGSYYYGPSAHEEYYDSFKYGIANEPAAHDMSFVYIERAAVDLGRAWDKAVGIASALMAIYEATVEAERKVKGGEPNASPASADSSALAAGFADGFYAAAAEAEKQRQEREKKKGELDDKYGDWLRKVKKGDSDLYEQITEDLTDEELAEFEEYLKEFYPDEWQRYQEMMAAQKEAKEYADWLESVKEHDPILYDEIMQKLADEEYAAWEKDLQENHPEEWKRHQEIVAEEEKRRKEAEEAAKALEAELEAQGDLDGTSDSSSGDSSDYGSSDWSSSSGSGSSDWSSGSSDYGGGSSFGSVDDWGSDLLADTVDAEELSDSGSALSDVASASTGAATGVGADVLSEDGVLEVEDPSFWGAYGSQIASFAHAYGLQAAALVGGAATLYATREQTTEAVALAAEFISTKCKPFAADVVDQVRGATKQTHVDLSHAKSRATDYSQEEREGDLLG